MMPYDVVMHQGYFRRPVLPRYYVRLPNAPAKAATFRLLPVVTRSCGVLPHVLVATPPAGKEVAHRRPAAAAIDHPGLGLLWCSALTAPSGRRSRSSPQAPLKLPPRSCTLA